MCIRDRYGSAIEFQYADGNILTHEKDLGSGHDGTLIEYSALLGAALTEQKEGNYSKAIDYYTQATVLNPDRAAAYGNRGVVYVNSGQFDLAIEDFDKTLELDRDNAPTYYNRGTAYLNKREFGKAIQDFDNPTKHTLSLIHI